MTYSKFLKVYVLSGNVLFDVRYLKSRAGKDENFRKFNFMFKPIFDALKVFSKIFFSCGWK